MKKKLFFLTIAITVLLTLSGCNAILEVFYPEFAIGNTNENVISIWAEFYLYPEQLIGTGQYIAGQVIDTQSKTERVVQELGVEPTWHRVNEKNNEHWRLAGNLDFRGVENGDYKVRIWLEQNRDNIFDPETERSIFAKADATGTIFFSFPSEKASNGWLYGEAMVSLIR